MQTAIRQDIWLNHANWKGAVNHPAPMQAAPRSRMRHPFLWAKGNALAIREGISFARV
jgi:hypothetical protein